MVSLPQQNRYLWAQLVGLAAVPLLLDVCLAGLASARETSGYPSAFGLQYWLIAAVCVLPPLAMQCLRPFYVFSLPPLALKPSVLTVNQRRCLRLLESWQIKALAVASAALSLWVLAQLYGQSAQVTPLLTPKVGIAIAIAAFFFACLFLQISISSLRLIFVGPEALKRVQPFEPPAIAASFLILGLRVNKVLPNPAEEPELADVSRVESPTTPANATQSPNLREPNLEKPTAVDTSVDKLLTDEVLATESVADDFEAGDEPSRPKERNQPEAQPEEPSQPNLVEPIKNKASQTAEATNSTLDEPAQALGNSQSSDEHGKKIASEKLASEELASEELVREESIENLQQSGTSNRQSDRGENEEE